MSPFAMPLSQIRIVHQDDALLVVDKPTLLLSVPGRADDNKDRLVTRLQENGYPEARIVHRLDWETSGLMVLARDADSHRELSRQFHDRETEKAYTALCWGLPELDSGRIELPLRYDPPTKPRHVVDFEHGRHALTFWRVIERHERWSRVELTPITGRSHQLRVHMLSIGHPLLGDRLYANPGSPRRPRTPVPARQPAVPDPSAERRTPALRVAGAVLSLPRRVPARRDAARRFPVPRLAIQRPASAFSGRPRRQRPEPRRTTTIDCMDCRPEPLCAQNSTRA